MLQSRLARCIPCVPTDLAASLSRASSHVTPNPRKEIAMARLFAAITRALREETITENVHFHGGPTGPYVCENARCTSPGLDPEAA